MLVGAPLRRPKSAFLWLGQTSGCHGEDEALRAGLWLGWPALGAVELRSHLFGSCNFFGAPSLVVQVLSFVGSKRSDRYLD